MKKRTVVLLLKQLSEATSMEALYHRPAVTGTDGDISCTLLGAAGIASPLCV